MITYYNPNRVLTPQIIIPEIPYYGLCLKYTMDEAASEESRWSKPTSLGCTPMHPAGWRDQSDGPNLRIGIEFLAGGRHQ